MYATKTVWNDKTRETILQWTSLEAAFAYAKRMCEYGYTVTIWKLP